MKKHILGAPRAVIVLTWSAGSCLRFPRQSHVGAYRWEPVTPRLWQDGPNTAVWDG